MAEYNLGHVVGEKGPKGDSGSDATATQLTDTVTTLG